MKLIIGNIEFPDKIFNVESVEEGEKIGEEHLLNNYDAYIIPEVFSGEIKYLN